MTINSAQGKALFSQPGVWDMTFIARPIDALSALGALVGSSAGIVARAEDKAGAADARSAV